MPVFLKRGQECRFGLVALLANPTVRSHFERFFVRRCQIA